MKYTMLIFSVCTAVFIMQIANPQLTEGLVLNSSNIFGLFTYMFAHANLFHYLLNMLALFAFGPVVEEVFGSRMLLLFVISGIVAGLFSQPVYSTVTGASGAIYGLIGTAALLRPDRETWVSVIGFGTPMPLLLAALVYGILDFISLFSYSGIAHIAHLAGLGVGIAYALINRGKASPI